jgi:hypothetical protein
MKSVNFTKKSSREKYEAIEIILWRYKVITNKIYALFKGD